MDPDTCKELQALIRRHVEAENAHHMEDTLATRTPPMSVAKVAAAS